MQMPLLIIARLTLHEAVRRRLLLAVALLTLVMIVFTGWGFSRINGFTGPDGQPLSSVEVASSETGLVILIAWMFSVVLAIGAAFLAAPAVAADVESGLLLAILPRPIRRSDLLIGKWLGLALLLACYAAVAGWVELTVIQAQTVYQAPHPLAAVAFLIGQSLVMLTLAMLCSTRLSPITGGIIGVMLFGMAWIGGILSSLGHAFHNNSLNTASSVLSVLVPTDDLWRGAVFNLEPPFVIIASQGIAREAPFGVAAPPPTGMVVWACVWVVGVLALSVLFFSRRDL
jgi:ABC-type transport system involved in multi-copper enzyme maturation permease subunit